jgi:hypothetical protein
VTDAEHARWLAYLRDLADRLGLRDWRLDLDRDPTAGGLLAHVEVTDGARWALVTLGPTWGVLPPDRQRQALVHELIHPHFQEIAEAVAHGREVLGGTAIEVVERAVRHQIEHAVDALAEAVAPLLPLPGAEP